MTIDLLRNIRRVLFVLCLAALSVTVWCMVNNELEMMREEMIMAEF